MHELDGVLPVRFEYTGRRVRFALAPRDPKPGELVAVKILVNDRQHASCNANAVKGELVRSSMFSFQGNMVMIAGMSPAEVAELTKK